ncbi:MAG: hypothetical protein WC330_08290, partial [Candidatus Omnitrophota bacterium]
SLAGKIGPYQIPQPIVDRGVNASPLGWILEEYSSDLREQEKRGRLFGKIDITEKALGDLPLWPVDEDGRFRKDLIGWILEPGRAPPLDYYTAEKLSLRQLYPKLARDFDPKHQFVQNPARQLTFWSELEPSKVSSGASAEINRCMQVSTAISRAKNQAMVAGALRPWITSDSPKFSIIVHFFAGRGIVNPRQEYSRIVHSLPNVRIEAYLFGKKYFPYRAAWTLLKKEKEEKPVLEIGIRDDQEFPWALLVHNIVAALTAIFPVKDTATGKMVLRPTSYITNKSVSCHFLDWASQQHFWEVKGIADFKGFSDRERQELIGQISGNIDYTTSPGKPGSPSAVQSIDMNESIGNTAAFAKGEECPALFDKTFPVHNPRRMSLSEYLKRYGGEMLIIAGKKFVFSKIDKLKSPHNRARSVIEFIPPSAESNKFVLAEGTPKEIKKCYFYEGPAIAVHGRTHKGNIAAQKISLNKIIRAVSKKENVKQLLAIVCNRKNGGLKNVPIPSVYANAAIKRPSEKYLHSITVLSKTQNDVQTERAIDIDRNMHVCFSVNGWSTSKGAEHLLRPVVSYELAKASSASSISAKLIAYKQTLQRLTPSISGAARILDCSRHGLSNYFRDHPNQNPKSYGINPGKMPKPEEKKDIYAELLIHTEEVRGNSAYRVSKIIGCSETGLIRVLLKYGDSPAIKKLHITIAGAQDPTIEEFLNKYRNEIGGKTIAEVARIIGVSRSGLHDYFRRHHDRLRYYKVVNIGAVRKNANGEAGQSKKKSSSSVPVNADTVCIERALGEVEVSMGMLKSLFSGLFNSTFEIEEYFKDMPRAEAIVVNNSEGSPMAYGVILRKISNRGRTQNRNSALNLANSSVDKGTTSSAVIERFEEVEELVKMVLTKTEEQVLRSISEGRSLGAVAENLKITPQAAKRIYEIALTAIRFVLQCRGEKIWLTDDDSNVQKAIFSPVFSGEKPQLAKELISRRKMLIFGNNSLVGKIDRRFREEFVQGLEDAAQKSNYWNVRWGREVPFIPVLLIQEAAKEALSGSLRKNLEATKLVSTGRNLYEAREKVYHDKAPSVLEMKAATDAFAGVNPYQLGCRVKTGFVSSSSASPQGGERF